MKITKQLFFLLIFILLFKSANANPLISIQNCANKQETDKQIKSLNKWLALNSYDEILKEHNFSLNKHKKIVKIIEEELSYLSQINFIELQDEYLENSLFLPFLTVLFPNNQNDFQWDEFSESSRLYKRILSDYFQDYKKTKTSLETKMKTHQILETEEVNKINELKKMRGKYNIFLEKKINEKKQNLENLLKKNLDDKMSIKSYNQYFFQCEQERVIAPITFDYKWK